MKLNRGGTNLIWRPKHDYRSWTESVHPNTLLISLEWNTKRIYVEVVTLEASNPGWYNDYYYEHVLFTLV